MIVRHEQTKCQPATTKTTSARKPESKAPIYLSAHHAAISYRTPHFTGLLSLLRPSTLDNRCLVKFDDLPAQQLPQLRTNDLLLLSIDTLRDSLSNRIAGVRASRIGRLRGIIVLGRFALTDAWDGEVVLLVDRFDGALETAEQAFGSYEGGL
jgi:hypothetical protein